jgi:hypothetical protein
MMWPDDDGTGDETGGVNRDFANSLTMAIIVLLICLLLVACAEAVGHFDTLTGWLYGL